MAFYGVAFYTVYFIYSILVVSMVRDRTVHFIAGAQDFREHALNLTILPLPLHEVGNELMQLYRRKTPYITFIKHM
jgi:hypothetical protein